MEVKPTVEDILAKKLDKGLEREAFMNRNHVAVDAVLSRKRLTIFVKRCYDLLFSAVGLLVLLPIFAVIAALIKLDSPGPVFYSQVRIGKDGVPFKIFKFRKMYEYIGDGGSNLTMANDQRMTRMGHFLRKSKIDELPQAFNVLLGDMALGD